MGRIRYKAFFCVFCIDRNQEQAAQEDTYNLGVDVSHLATPHISSNHSLTMATSSQSANSTPVGDSSSINIADDSNLSLNQSLIHNSQLLEHRRGPSECNASQSSQPFQDNNNNTSTDIRLHLPPNSHTPVPSPPAPSNLYELSREASPASSSQEPPADLNLVSAPPVATLRVSQRDDQHVSNNSVTNKNPDHDKPTATKLSYDIISVREPLAKILADRQQAQQLQQRNILGDHEYIEVYGERGSSCFYEEIASSTTSSATYDQIGTNSNHNYQVLVNSYAAVNRQPLHRNTFGPLTSDSVDNPISNLSDSIQPHNNSPDNLYDLTHPPPTHPTTQRTNSPIPSTSKASQQPPQLNHHNDQVLTGKSSLPPSGAGPSTPAKSMPVYSVINKSTRRNNLPTKKIPDNRAPQPPPKNLTSPSAIPKQSQYNLLSSTVNKQISHLTGTSFYASNTNNNDFGNKPEPPSYIPRPPPRFSKLPRFNAMSRPLPMPDSPCLDSNDGPLTMMSLINHQNGDSESLNSGYELLSPNFDDEQIDVGYEKIRECNRYSGGSLSSQFNPLNVLDNGGYESVQPIYSSPSNALAEPNYEAIGPATASEIAAAATARLTAAATVIEQFLNQD